MASESVMKQCGTITGNCTYIVPADADPQRMIEDVGCWLGSTRAVLHSVIDRLNESAKIGTVEKECASEVYAALHLLNLAKDVTEAIEQRMLVMR